MSNTAAETCFVFWDLGVQACAAWVQAWGSILALAVAAAGLIYQARQQKKLAESLAKRDAKEQYLRRVGAFGAIATGANNLALQLIDHVTDRATFAREVLEGKFEQTALELRAMERWLYDVPIYDVPQEALHQMMVLSSSVRQLRNIVDTGIRLSGQMDDIQFQSFREALPNARDPIAGSAVILNVWTNRARDTEV
jgi:hypothetical protein